MKEWWADKENEIAEIGSFDGVINGWMTVAHKDGAYALVMWAYESPNMMLLVKDGNVIEQHYW